LSVRQWVQIALQTQQFDGAGAVDGQSVAPEKGMVNEFDAGGFGWLDGSEAWGLE